MNCAHTPFLHDEGMYTLNLLTLREERSAPRMPTYEYVCRDCGHHFELVQSFNDEALTECPSCKGTLRKVFGNIGIAFKGEGFYKTDSRKKASKDSDTKSPSSTEKTEKSEKPETTKKTEKPKPKDTSSDASSAAS
jgi:putative FmdB family regulatory protein